MFPQFAYVNLEDAITRAQLIADPRVVVFIS